ncbi:MAG: hypothetical protein V4751_14590 [Pseudomonadota bacterium]
MRTTLLLIALLLTASCRTPEQFRGIGDEEVREFDRVLKFNSYLISDIVGEYYTVKAQGLYGPKDVERTREERRYDWWPRRKISEVYILEKAKENGFELMSDPNFDGRPGSFTVIRPNLGDLRSEVLCFYRSIHDNKIYEYWVIKIWGTTDGTRSISFLVTAADSLEKPREILTIDEHYIREFKVSEEVAINFPESDLSALYMLEAWLFPIGFPDSELKNTEVLLSREAGSIAAPYDPNGGVQMWRDITPKEVEEFFNVR